MYGKLMSIPDSLIIKYLELLTDFPISTIRGWEREMRSGLNPKLIKEELAVAIVSTFYNREQALECKEEFNRVFAQREIPSEIPISRLPKDYFKNSASLVDILVAVGLVSSKSEARRIIRQRGVKVDGSVVEDPDLHIVITPGIILQVGKRRFLRLEPLEMEGDC
jgi:Tyrosyl-tRNA synthetase